MTDMVALNIQPNAVTYNMLLRICSRSQQADARANSTGSIDGAERSSGGSGSDSPGAGAAGLLARMREEGITIAAEHYHTAMRLCLEAGHSPDVRTAMAVLGGMCMTSQPPAPLNPMTRESPVRLSRRSPPP
jgi:hypothetical protein